jgi:hypothetical protein
VAFSLYGSDERYTGGALANARALYRGKSAMDPDAPRLLPHFRMRVYHDHSVGKGILAALERLDVEVVDVLATPTNGDPMCGRAGQDRAFCSDESSDPGPCSDLGGGAGGGGGRPGLRGQELNGRTWRFAVASDPAVARFLVRDVDSRLSSREVAAVQDWVLRKKPFHVMRDHPR